jgi:hypothetical protein
MAFIDATYFKGEINIQTLPASDTSLIQAIDQYEKEILIQLLGYKLYSLLIADCTNYVPATTKYQDLVNGKEFVYNDITYKWNGFKNTDKQSLIAYYVFYKYVERDVTRLYGTGVGISPNGNGWERVSPVNKLCAAWERMRELYGKIPDEYKGMSPIIGASLPGVQGYEPTAYNFLYANITDYPDWIFTPQWNINQFGI